MSVSPIGIVSQPLEQAALMLCGSSAWQQWCGVGNSVHARGHVFIGQIEESEARQTDPWALVDYHRSWPFRRIASQTYRPGGSMIVILTGLVPDEYRAKWEDAQVWFTNHVGAVIADLVEASGHDLRIDFDSFELAELARADTKIRPREGDWFQAVLIASYGGGG